MKKIEYIILFMLLVKTISSYAQLQQYIADSDLQTMNSVKYQGKMYLYYNIFAYNGTESLPPMPFQGGRIRDGKYKASATAMNNYIEEFKKNSGQAYTFVRFFQNPQIPGQPGIVFANNKADTIFVNATGVKEFFSVEYLETGKKNIGKKLYEIDLSSFMPFIKDTPYAAFLTYSDTQTKELKPSFLPFMSEWIIKDVNYDTNYYGEHTPFNDNINGSYNRLCYVIENKKYGSLNCFFNNQKHTFSKDEAYSKVLPLISRDQFDYRSYSEEDLRILEKWAKEGTADMKYFHFAVAEHVKKANGGEEVWKYMAKLAEEGSLAAVYTLVSNHALAEIPLEKLCGIVKKSCQPVEKLLIYSEIYRKTGDYIVSVFPMAVSKEELDEDLKIAKEMYKLAEECGTFSMEEYIKRMEARYSRSLQQIQSQ